MRKYLIIVAILCTCLITQPVHANNVPEIASCKRLTLTLLSPMIQKQLNVYYQDKLTMMPIFAPFLGPVSMEIREFSSHLDVEVIVVPYVGPHLDVGVDALILRVDNLGKVTLIHYNHIKDIELPFNYQNIVIKSGKKTKGNMSPLSK